MRLPIPATITPVPARNCIWFFANTLFRYNYENNKNKKESLAIGIYVMKILHKSSLNRTQSQPHSRPNGPCNGATPRRSRGTALLFPKLIFGVNFDVFKRRCLRKLDAIPRTQNKQLEEKRRGSTPGSLRAKYWFQNCR